MYKYEHLQTAHFISMKNFSNTYCSSVFVSEKPVHLQYFDSVYIFQDVETGFYTQGL